MSNIYTYLKFKVIIELDSRTIPCFFEVTNLGSGGLVSNNPEFETKFKFSYGYKMENVIVTSTYSELVSQLYEHNLVKDLN